VRDSLCELPGSSGACGATLRCIAERGETMGEKVG